MDEGRVTGDGSVSRGGRGRVLVVEDDHELSSYLAECLEMAGYRPIVSRNGLEGLQALESHRPDLAVVDLNMPVMSGFRFLQLLRKGVKSGQPRMPVIVITGQDAEETLDLVVEAKPDAYLQKPFEPRQFLERVDRLMASAPPLPLHLGELDLSPQG